VTDAESRFAARALRRKRLFLVLSIAGLVIAAMLSAYYTFRIATDPTFPFGPRLVIVVLILLNARQNLRQYRFAGILEQVLPPDRSRPGEGAHAGR
jgi:hypothetical protein